MEFRRVRFRSFLKLIREVRPAQATLVPDKPDAITSNAGWDTVSNAEFLKEVVKEIRGLDVRVSVFVDPVLRMIEGAAKLEVDRIELYTEPYAHDFLVSRDISIKPYVESSRLGQELGLGVNAGHKPDTNHLPFFHTTSPHLDQKISV